MLLIFTLLVLVGLASGVLIRLFVDPRLPPIDLRSAPPGVERTVGRYVRALDRDRRSGPAWGELGAVLFAYQQTAPALTSLIEAENRDPRDPRWPYLQGLLLRERSPARALDRFRRTVELCTNTPPAPRLRLAQTLIAGGDWTNATRELEALLAGVPDEPYALLLKVQCLQHEGDLGHALAVAQRAARNPVTARPGLLKLAELHQLTGNPTAAASATHQAQQASGTEEFPDPFLAEALARRGDPHSLSQVLTPLLDAQRLDEATNLIERLRREYPNAPETTLAVGRFEMLRHQPSLAEQALQTHVRSLPGSAPGWYHLGRVLLAQQRDGEAAKAFANAVEIQPDLADAWYQRAVATSRLSRRAEATNSLQRAIHLQPAHVDSYLLLAEVLLQQNNPAEALRWLDEAGRLEPTNGRVSLLRAQARAPVTPTSPPR